MVDILILQITWKQSILIYIVPWVLLPTITFGAFCREYILHEAKKKKSVLYIHPTPSQYTCTHSFLFSCSLVVSAKIVIGEQKDHYFKKRLHKWRKYLSYFLSNSHFWDMREVQYLSIFSVIFFPPQGFLFYEENLSVLREDYIDFLQLNIVS